MGEATVVRKLLRPPDTILAKSVCMLPNLWKWEIERSEVTLWQMKAQVKGEFKCKSKMKALRERTCPTGMKKSFLSTHFSLLLPAPLQGPLREKNVRRQTTKDPKQVLAVWELNLASAGTCTSEKKYVGPSCRFCIWKGRPPCPSAEWHLRAHFVPVKVENIN